MTKTTETERREMVEECRASGKTIRSWCKEKGIAYSTYANWTKKVPRTRDFDKNKSNGWVKVVPAFETMDDHCETVPTAKTIRISKNGFEINVEAGFDSGHLTELLRVVNAVCC